MAAFQRVGFGIKVAATSPRVEFGIKLSRYQGID
jgi:hypothetical protein